MEFIQPEQLAQLRRFSLTTKNRARGHHKGLHRSLRMGASLDFSDYREYHAGDDIRQLDWNVFARTEKHYIKRFLDEQEMRIHIMLDTTKSMDLYGKLNFSKLIASSLATIALERGDTVSFSATPHVPQFKRKGRNGVLPLLQAIHETETLDGNFSEQMIRQLPKASTIIYVITDGLEPSQSIMGLFDKLIQYGKDIRWLRVFSESEEDAHYNGDREMIDIETNEKINVSFTNDVYHRFEEERNRHFYSLLQYANRNHILTIDLKVEEGFQGVLQSFIRAQWIR